MSVTIIKNETSVLVKSPFSSAFVAGARALGGRWNAPNWMFDARDEERVRALCLEIYGDDGRAPVDRVTLRVSFPEYIGVLGDSIRIGGREVARAFGRDSGARLGEDVVVLSGGFGSGGSVKNWKTVSSKGAVVLVREVPRPIADRLLAPGGLDGELAVAVEIEPETPVIDRAALTAERARLIARLEEIDAALAA